MSSNETSVQLRPARYAERFINAASAVVPDLRPKLVTGFYRMMYSGLSRVLKNEDSAFLNYGFSSLDAAEPKLALDPADEPDRYSIQLYHRVASAVPLSGKQVVEIGCGRGGGASFVVRYLRPASMTGIDLSKRAIDLCRERHKIPNLTFVPGNAEDLPLPSNSCDVVLNVESSHCYPSFDRFTSEVARVLKAGGYFLFADLRGRDQVPQLRADLEQRFEIMQEEPIGKNVVRALELDSERRVALIRRRAPKFLYTAMDAFASVNGSPTFVAFASGDLQYVRFVLKRRQSS